MDNYPDDIRMYDKDPRSPFYEEPPEVECPICDSVMDEIEAAYFVCPECGHDLDYSPEYEPDEDYRY